ncbi:hypothetical protein AURDEDRAFT_168053 [Auricularia subglabra TFB-10046 SS5]|nr:hypothetical protein AURDEDRAFT_168053 [Auricularia subglabra TFB-10046 SS5]
MLSFLLIISFKAAVFAATVNVTVGDQALVFKPNTIKAARGDIIRFQFIAGVHSVSQSGGANVPCVQLEAGFDSAFVSAANGQQVWELTIDDDTKPIWFFCKQGAHCQQGMAGVINAASDDLFDQYITNAKAFTGSQPAPQVSLKGVGASAAKAPAPADIGNSATLPVFSGSTGSHRESKLPSTPVSTPPTSLTPTELSPPSTPTASRPASAWLQYLSQPELLLVGALSKSLRALVMDEPHFYLAVHLQTIRGRHHQTFIQRLNSSARRKLPIGVILDFPYAPTKSSCDILAKKVSPAIKRAMPYIRKLSLLSAVPLPSLAVEFLLAPAPLLHAFTYRIADPDCEGDEEDYESMDGSDYGSSSYAQDNWEPTPYTHPKPLPARLFDRAAPKLLIFESYGIPFAEQPVVALSAVTHATVSETSPVPRTGLGMHFPSAKRLKLSLEEDYFKQAPSCTRSAWLPAGLASLDLGVSVTVLRKFLQLVDLAAVPTVRIDFDSHYGWEYSRASSAPNARDAAWAACLAHLAAPHRLDISCTSSDSDGHPDDFRISVSERAHSVTFYAGDVFMDEWHDGVPYIPLSGLRPIVAGLTVISVDQEHIQAVYHISTALPALRVLHVRLRRGARAPIWDKQAGLVECPALERLVLFCDSVSGALVASNELANFAQSLGLSPARRPRLVLHRVLVARGTDHAAFFETYQVPV